MSSLDEILRSYGHTSITTTRFVGAADGSSVYQIQPQHQAIIAAVGDPANTVELALAPIEGAGGGCSLYFIQWDGQGTLTLTPAATDKINGGAAGVSSTYLGSSFGTVQHHLILLCGYLNFNNENMYRTFLLSGEGGASSIYAVAPNVQVTATNNINAGHASGPRSIVLMETGAVLPTLLTASTNTSVVIGYQAGTNAGVTKNVGTNATILGPSAGGGATAIAAEEICLGWNCQASGVVGRLSVAAEGNFIDTNRRWCLR